MLLLGLLPLFLTQRLVQQQLQRPLVLWLPLLLSLLWDEGKEALVLTQQAACRRPPQGLRSRGCCLARAGTQSCS